LLNTILAVTEKWEYDSMKRAAWAIFVCFLLCLSLFAQGGAVAQISGTVKDQSGAVLPGVDITVTQTDTSATRMTVTNETGAYAIPNLAVGPYKLEASLPGFVTFIQSGSVLQAN